jgi:hypothetical protein
VTGPPLSLGVAVPNDSIRAARQAGFAGPVETGVEASIAATSVITIPS